MLIIPISSIFYKIKICATSERQPRYLVATLPYFSQRFDISVRDFASRRKIGIESGKAKERQRGGERKGEGGEGDRGRKYLYEGTKPSSGRREFIAFRRGEIERGRSTGRGGRG